MGFAVSLCAERETSEGLRSEVVCRTIDSHLRGLNTKRKTRLWDGWMGQAPELDEFGFDSPRRSDFANLRQVNQLTPARAGLGRFAGVFG
jgi:hypothetical protein